MSLSITPRLILEAAQKRGWKTAVLNEQYALYRIDVPDGEYYYVRNITSIKSGGVNALIADQKDLFYELVAGLGVPTPETLLGGGEPQLAYDFLIKHGRIVVKPTDQAHGKGITLDVTTQDQLDEALGYAASFGKKSLLQQQVEGDDYRLLFIDGELAAAAIRKPAYVVGDGEHSVAELIGIENASDRRGAGYQDVLSNIDAAGSERYLGKNLQDVPLAGQEVRVIGVANIGRGGVAIDVTDTINAELVQAGRTIVDHFGIGLCGIDFLVKPSGEAYLIEINTGPSLGLHEFPFSGKPRGTQDKFLDWLTKK